MPDTPYFTVAEFKARYPDDDLAQALGDEQINASRELAEEMIEGLEDDDEDGGCHQAFVVRTETFHLSGDGTTRLAIPRYRIRSVSSCTVGGAAVDPASLSIEASSLYSRCWTRGFGNVVVTVTHGMDAPPLQIKRAAIVLAYHDAIKGPIADRATGIATDAGIITLATPGRAGWNTGIPDVDKAIARYRLPLLKPVSIPLGERGREYPPLQTL